MYQKVCACQRSRKARPVPLESEEADPGWRYALQACALGPVTEKNEDRFMT